MGRPDTTAAIVRQLRLSRDEAEGRRIKDLSHRARIDERTWRRVEKGEGYSRNTIHAIAGVLGKTVSELEPEVDPPVVTQLDRIELKVNLLIALLRGEDLDAQAWGAAERALELDVPQLDTQRGTRA